MSEIGVVLLSGGIDSTVCAKIAADTLGNGNVHALNMHYGQKHGRETRAAHDVYEALDLRKYEPIFIEDLFAGTDCCLIATGVEIPNTSYDKIEGISPMYVPFRNGLFLSIATTYALQVNASFIYFGAHGEDAHNFAYPDTTPEFNGSMASAIYNGTHGLVRLVTPFQWGSKDAVIYAGLQIGAPLELTYSCYRGGEYHCGFCATCISRINAFKAVGVVDPVKYAIDIDWEGLEDQIDLSH